MKKLNWKLNTQTIIAVIGIIVFALLIIFGTRFLSKKSDTLFVAVVGPMSGDDASKGEEMVRGVSLYVDEVNAAGGVNGKKIELLIFDDQNDHDLARSKALEIAQESNALVVLGHRSTDASIQGGEVYQDVGIAAISGSEAVTEGNDWYFRTTSSNHAQAVFLANYVRRILDQDTVSIIYDQDAYGSSLAESFKNTFGGLGGKVKFIWSFDAEAENLDDTFDQIIADLLRARNDKPGMIFMATHGSEAVKLVTGMRRKGLSYSVIGTDSLGTPAMVEKFAAYPEEQGKPGYLSDGIFASTDILFDVAGEKAIEFSETFIDSYAEEPGARAATYYNAAAAAVHAIIKSGAQGDPEMLEEERQNIRDQLASMNNSKSAADGIGGPIFFNNKGDVVKTMSVGVFDHQHFISALTQLQPINDLDRIPDLDAALEAGQIHIVNSEYLYQTNVVYVGMDINEVSNLNIKNSSYTVDFYLWFRYRGDFEPHNIEFINTKGSNKLGSPVIDQIVDGVAHKLYRVKTDFVGDFSFYDYPFDKQELTIAFRHTDMTRENLIYTNRE